jgi:hypothetical protein
LPEPRETAAENRHAIVVGLKDSRCAARFLRG